MPQNKRKCRLCGKTLADLNPNEDLCFAHDLKYPKYDYIPVTKCTGASSVRAFEAQSDDPFFPGSESYNEMAFHKVLIYPDLEDGEDDGTKS